MGTPIFSISNSDSRSIFPPLFKLTKIGPINWPKITFSPKIKCDTIWHNHVMIANCFFTLNSMMKPVFNFNNCYPLKPTPFDWTRNAAVHPVYYTVYNVYLYNNVFLNDGLKRTTKMCENKLMLCGGESSVRVWHVSLLGFRELI